MTVLAVICGWFAPSAFITSAVWFGFGLATTNSSISSNAAPDPIQNTSDGSMLNSTPPVEAQSPQPRQPNMRALPYSKKLLRLTRSM
ncbi:hypothetical protein D3C80_1598210 [compost metagenome]